MIKNTENSYGLVSILIHWVMALVIIAMFCLGLWMVELDYYSEWYKQGPDIHRSIGVLVFMALLFRLLWRLICPSPKPEPSLGRWERVAALAVHWLLYLLLLLIIVSGYLISTADGRSVQVFSWFSVPATLTSIENQEDISGELHYIFAVSLMLLVSIHALAALKHHFYDRDQTLLRMLGKAVR